MTDTAMHFIACFSIVVVVFIVEYGWLSVRYMPSLVISKTTAEYWYKRIVNESVIKAVTWSLVVGFGKEVVDIFRSDPQFKDLVADMAGAFTAGLLIWLIGTYYITRRFKSE